MPKHLIQPRKKAVALHYEPGRDAAPRVVAAGRGEVAERILALARQNNVPIHNNPDLAAILITLDLNSVIPPELYPVVAEILAFVYRLNAKAKAQRRG